LKIRFYTKIGVKHKTTSTCKEVTPNKDTNQHHEPNAKQPQQGTKDAQRKKLGAFRMAKIQTSTTKTSITPKKNIF